MTAKPPRKYAARLGEIREPFSGKFIAVVARDGIIAFRPKGTDQTRYLTLMEAYSVAKVKPFVDQL